MAKPQNIDTDTRDREAFEAQFASEPNAQLPQTVQQVMIDDRPLGAMRVAVERDLQKVMANIRKEATAAGDDFFYSWPTKNKDGSVGEVSGASVKCANAVSRIYGNCSVQVRAFDQGPHWIFYARFYDMETGYVYERPFQQRKGQNVGGKMDKDRAADIVFQIGVSKAARNVVCNALSTFTDYAFDVAREQLVEKIGKNLPKYVELVKKRLAEMNVALVRVESVRGKTIATWNAGDVAKTVAEIQGVNDGMAHPDELWPTAEAKGPRPTQDDTPAADDKPKGEPVKPTEGSGKPTAAEGKPAATDAPVVTEAKGEVIVDPAKAEAEYQDMFARAEKAIELNSADLDATTRETIAELDEGVRETIKNWEGLDDEDKSLLLGRWNTKVLERQRTLTRGKKR